jgi:periplasmic divalent cation tolerance protein
VLCTCATEEEAEKLARLVVGSNLAACVNVIPQVRSFYHWQGAIESAQEFLLIVKSSRERFPELRTTLESAHSYEIPEVLSLPIVDGSANYLNWMDSHLQAGRG